jgi:phenylpropionate dioxygenase-like ring-hydroxylating dioxygenase large terminal subunit
MAVAETTAGASGAPTPPAAFLLPPTAYTDTDWLAREQAGLFHRSWSLVADAAELAQPGDRVAVVVGQAPIVVVRTDDGLRAFHNVCRHRGMTVIQPPGTFAGPMGEAIEKASCETLRCPYHGWEWGLDGTLVRVPQRKTQFPDLDADALGLHPASVAEWEGMVFVSAEPDVDLAADLAGLDEHLGSFRPGLLPQVAQVRLEAACNWKLFVENHIDVYHLWYLHDRTLADFDHTRFEHHELGRSWASYEPMREAVPATEQDVVRHLDERDRRGIQAHMLFPHTLMAASSTFFATYTIRPLGPDRSWIDLRIRAEPDADADALVATTRAFIDEDIAACEQVQAALHSPRFSVGPLARTHERPITTFHQHLLDVLHG